MVRCDVTEHFGYDSFLEMGNLGGSPVASGQTMNLRDVNMFTLIGSEKNDACHNTKGRWSTSITRPTLGKK